MGRVDEAMRRANQAGGQTRQGEKSGDAESEYGERLPVDSFPVEAAARAKLRPVEPTTEAATRTQSLFPPLMDRVGAGLSRKVVIDQEMDPASKEQYRRLATSLHAAQAANGLKALMVASALASEGKSLTAANLALTFSESYGKSVLLIDGDLRRPSIHTLFGLDSSPGLSTGLNAVEDERLALHHVSPHLTILTAGQPTSDPMAGLASERMKLLVQEARETFDWVIVDTPPVELLSDASLVAETVDGALLVVRAESTPYDIVQRAVARLGKERVLGVVLNRAVPQTEAGYKYHGYYDPPSTSMKSQG